MGKPSEETEAQRHKKEYKSAHAVVFFVKITPDFGNTVGLGIVGVKNIWSVEFVLELLASGAAVKNIVKVYPHLSEEAVKAVLVF